jgi:isopenicillin-N N-acyltransferase-like protein
MVRQLFWSASILLITSLTTGCSYLRIDPNHYLFRSDVIESVEQERAIVAKAKLAWTQDGRVRVLYVSGTPYERGYQQGRLLREEVRANLMYLYDKILEKYHFEELLDESFERQRPFIPQEYIDEMHGLAHGSRLPLRVVHAIHALPEITEWGGKRKYKKLIKEMMDGVLLGTSCSNFCAAPSATGDKKMYTVRILDWGLHKLSKLHEYPLITVNVPEDGNKGVPSANIGWVGFLGAVSGMNAEGITLGEMGYGDPDGETMRGRPMPFVLRDVLRYAKNLKDVRKIIKEAPPTNSFVFLMSDGKTGESELYLRDRFRFEVHKPGVLLEDKGNKFPAIKGILYGGHYQDKMTSKLGETQGTLTAEMIMKDVIPFMAMPSNFQNVLYSPSDLTFWFTNAAGPKERAAEQPYTFYDFKAGLKEFEAEGNNTKQP